MDSICTNSGGMAALADQSSKSEKTPSLGICLLHYLGDILTWKERLVWVLQSLYSDGLRPSGKAVLKTLGRLSGQKVQLKHLLHLAQQMPDEVVIQVKLAA